ncbi:MAG: type I-E CRISPR-associated protein Cse2/CasB [Ardenticatenaceae bacterium]
MRKDDPPITLFMERLNRLTMGELARLKRNTGKSLADSHHVLGLFFNLLPAGVSRYDEPWFFLVATLFPLTDRAETGTLGHALRRARSSENGEGLDRRFEVLLDADESQLPYRLRQAIRLLASNDVAINWPQLLSDLTNWTHPNRFVQERWARDYFSKEE